MASPRLCVDGPYRPHLPHICGLYYNVQQAQELHRYYLPQVETRVHASILSTISRTQLTQSFANPSDTKGIKEARFTFPLYDRVSVVGFTCQIGDRVIAGEVKEKSDARVTYDEAVSEGETASLFEQLPNASDVFTTTIGNIPPGAMVLVKITFLGELKHDMEIDGIRYTVPTKICPRYGKGPPVLQGETAAPISIVVDAEVPEGSVIQQIMSPSHPIAVSMGTTSVAPNMAPSNTKASATLSLGQANMDTDFILQIVTKDIGVPRAILETHPTIPHQRALMATLVPKFVLPPEKPEIVFVCDRSGSMGGTRIRLAIQALRVFLKSLPVGVKFNICSFGSRHSFLWPKSVTYSQQTLDEAMQHVEGFQANLGGTEMLAPFKATIEQRFNDIPLEVMFLTDGQIWNQETLFSFLNEKVIESKAPIRVFTLGVGTGVSHALIEGVARAGNGFSQSVGEEEKMSSKVVRMLKGALSPHISDYRLEVNYSLETAEEDDFEMVENPSDPVSAVPNSEEQAGPVKPIKLYDENIDPDQKAVSGSDDKYAHLPEVYIPKTIQAPQNIPPLFAFNRVTVYLLLCPDSPPQTPLSVTLRGTSKQGPLELDIPVHVLDQTGETIHQLAAKKAVAELEEGRGWLAEAKDRASGKLLKDRYEGRFSDMVEREAVRLGVQFQVSGKFCSFVAVEKNNDQISNRGGEEMDADQEWLDVTPSGVIKVPYRYPVHGAPGMAHPRAMPYSSGARCLPSSVARFASQVPAVSLMTPRPQMNGQRGRRGVRRSANEENTASSDGPDGQRLSFAAAGASLQTDVSAPPAVAAAAPSNESLGSADDGNFGHQLDLLPRGLDALKTALPGAAGAKTPDEILDALIALQTFEGYWDASRALFNLIGVDFEAASKLGDDLGETVSATGLAVGYMERKLADKKDVWELVVEKAWNWLRQCEQGSMLGVDARTVDEVVERAAKLL